MVRMAEMEEKMKESLNQYDSSSDEMCIEEEPAISEISSQHSLYTGGASSAEAESSDSDVSSDEEESVETK